MTVLEVFLWGFGGSVAMDVVTVVKYYETATMKFPDCYGRFWYYIARLLLATLGGGLAVAYEIDKQLLAANIGAAAPLLLTALGQGFGGGAASAKLGSSPSSVGEPVQ